MKLVIATLAFLTFVQSTYATNRGFMPGDAFFHSELTQDICTALANADTPAIRYVRPKGNPIAGCGFAGYWSLRFPPGSKPLIRNLNVLYANLRRDSPRELTEYTDADGKTTQHEMNGFHIFVYNHDFDPLRYNIALRYNENWVANESSFGPHRSITQLESFVIDRVAFSNDWRDADAIPPLQTACPPIPDQENRMKKGIGNKRISDPVVATGKVQIIVTATDDFRRYIYRRNGATFYSVTDSGVKQYTFKKREWVVTEWSPHPE